MTKTNDFSYFELSVEFPQTSQEWVYFLKIFIYSTIEHLSPLKVCTGAYITGGTSHSMSNDLLKLYILEFS